MALSNEIQTPEERRQKYWLVRSMGQDSYTAQRQRDFKLSRLERLYGLILPGQTAKPVPSDYRGYRRLSRIKRLMLNPATATTSAAEGL